MTEMDLRSEAAADLADTLNKFMRYDVVERERDRLVYEFEDFGGRRRVTLVVIQSSAVDPK